MMRAPTLAAIYAAELRVVQATQNTRDSLGRARTALRANLAQPATLVMAAGAAGAVGFWLARRRRTRVASASAGVAAKTSAAGLVLALIVRYGKPALPFILRQVRAAWQQRAARTGIATSTSPARGYSPSDSLH